MHEADKISQRPAFAMCDAGGMSGSGGRDDI